MSDGSEALPGAESDAPQPDDLLYEAWGVIANASGWLEDTEWRAAAERWRDKWHATLSAERHATAIEDLTEAIRLTVEYIGIDTLPAIEGWSWYDALLKYAPEKAAVLAAITHILPPSGGRA